MVRVVERMEGGRGGSEVVCWLLAAVGGVEEKP